MAPLGALSQAWVSAEASLPLGWQIRGLWRINDLWVALSVGPDFDDYLSGSGHLRRPGAAATQRPAARAARADHGLMGPNRLARTSGGHRLFFWMVGLVWIFRHRMWEAENPLQLEVF